MKLRWEVDAENLELRTRIDELERELAARDLVIKQMQEAISAEMSETWDCNSYHPSLVKALALQPTTALDAYVAERTAEIEKQRDGLAKDAEMYRWLRDHSKSWSWNPSQYNKEIISGFAAFNAGYLGFAFESAVVATIASVQEGAVR